MRLLLQQSSACTGGAPHRVHTVVAASGWHECYCAKAKHCHGPWKWPPCTACAQDYYPLPSILVSGNVSLEDAGGPYVLQTHLLLHGPFNDVLSSAVTASLDLGERAGVVYVIPGSQIFLTKLVGGVGKSTDRKGGCHRRDPSGV